MSRRYLFAVAAALVAIPASAVEPEALLPASSQFYLRWDGIRAHQAAYDASARGQMFTGDTGRAFLAVRNFVLDRIRDEVTGSALSSGQSPDQLIQVNSDLKEIAGLPALFADHGIVLAGELRDPTRLTYDSLFQKVGKSVRKGDAMELVMPEVHIYAVVPGAAQKAGPIAAAFRLAVTQDNTATIKQISVAGRSVTVAAVPDGMFSAAMWAEGDHLVAYFGNGTVDGIVRKMQAAGPKLPSHRLYRDATAGRGFTPITRGFVDGTDFFANLKRLLTLHSPYNWHMVEAWGVTGIGAATFQFGFDGDVSRAWLELENPKSPFGLAGAMTRTPFEMKDLPPIPADAARWLGCRMDFSSLYDALLAIIAASELEQTTGTAGELDAAVAGKRVDASNEMDRALGIRVKDDLLSALGDKLVTYSAPSENAFMAVSTGQVIAVSVKDEAKLRAALNRLEKRLEAEAGSFVRLRTRKYHGVEIREHVILRGNAISPSYAICDGWLVLSFYSQPIQGFILRSRGKLPAWKPDERTAALLAKRPADAIGIEFSDPRVTLKQILTILPIVGGAVNGQVKSLDRALDISAFPNADEATRPLFPNVTWLRNDGKTFRFDAHDSIGLPLEFIGPDAVLPFAFGGLSFLF